MAAQTITLEALKTQPLEDLLHQVAEHLMTVTVLLPNGKEVVIEPKRRLQPLPAFEGRVPEGWEEALYGGD